MERAWKVPVTRYDHLTQETRDETEWVVSEVRYTLTFNGQEISRFPASPHLLRELAHGFLVGKGIITGNEPIHIIVQGKTIAVTQGEQTAKQLSPDRNMGEEHPDRGMGKPCRVLDPEMLLGAVSRLSSDSLLWKKTHGVHTIGVFTWDGQVVHLIEDVSRHSAFDKAVGKALREQVDLNDCFLALSCRISGDMVSKAALTGIRLLGSKSTITASAVEKALQEEITVVGYTQEDHFVVFTHPRRITM
jgi:FdhD protein